MGTYRFKQFGENVEITRIGWFFRKQPAGKWNISLRMSPPQPTSSVTISNAPAVIRKKILNCTEPEPRRWPVTFFIQSTSKWEVRQIKDCPIDRYAQMWDGAELCFAFTFNGMTIFIPQFELARSLFFKNDYLSRTAIESECLRTEFDVQVDDENNSALISVMPSSSCSKSHLESLSARNYLAWILIDQNIRRSFESISRYQKLTGWDSGGYRRWNFQFDPPSLAGVKVTARGHKCSVSNCFFVHEINELRFLPAQVPDNIEVYHPDFAAPIPGGGATAPSATSNNDDNIDIVDGSDANEDGQAIIIRASSTSIQFRKPFHTAKVTSKERKTSKPTKEKEEQDQATIVSTEETSAYGLPNAEWDALNDQTDYSGLFENKFNCFLKMINVLSSHYYWHVEDQFITELPRVGRCKKHILSTDGSPRCIAVVTLKAGGKTVHLLEVDTSDADKSLSTHILCVKDSAAWDENLARIKRALMQASLNWPKKMLDEICGPAHHKGVPHPQTPSANKGVLLPDSIAGWAHRIHDWMIRL